MCYSYEMNRRDMTIKISKKGNKKVDAVIETFGSLEVATVIVFCAALFAIWKLYRKAKKYIIEQYQREEEKDAKIQKCLDQIAMYPKWRQQSIDMQKKFTEDIKHLADTQKENIRRMEEIEKTNRKRKRNELRERLLQSYRYFTSKEKNPLLAWSEMESDSFWKIFKDYEELDGDGYVHSEVQPAMNSLEVIPMHETERISELMQRRK